jgi:hypothetical protein
MAGAWVILRFLFIDVWALRVVKRLRWTGAAAIREKIMSRLQDSKRMREVALANLAATFQLTNYAGIFSNEAVAKKKLIKDIGDRFPIYYPAKARGRIFGANESTEKTIEITVSPEAAVERYSDIWRDRTSRNF